MNRCIAAAAALGITLAALAGCDDMANQPKRKTYDMSRHRAPPAGTVARDEVDIPPPPVSLALLERGRQRFDIFCAPCHSIVGDGDGMIVRRGFPHPPDYASERLLNAPVQHFVDVIANGYGAMFSYAERVAPTDRWAIAAYIRALQASQHATLADLTPDERAKLP
jgi:hypothetical protein